MTPSRVARRLAAGVLTIGLVACANSSELPLANDETLTALLAEDWASTAAVADAVTDFEAERGVRVEVRSAPFGQLEEFVIADRAGSGDIDVSQWHAFAAGAREYAVPVTARFESEYPEGTFVPGAIEDVTWGDEVYGVPLDVNAMVMIVNTDLLAALDLGLDDLDTWSQARTVAEAAAEEGVRLTHLPASTWTTYAWLRSNGGRWFDFGPDASPRMLFDAPEVAETFGWLSDLVADGLAFAADDVDTSTDGFPLFADQRTLALTTGTWDVARLQSEEPPFEWAVRPMPIGPSGNGPATVLGGSSLYVTEQADDVDLAWEFVTHLIEPRYALQYAQDQGRLPARTGVLSDPFFDDERYRTAVDQLPNASAMRLLAFPQVQDLATRSIYEVLHDEAEPRAAFRSVQQRAEQLVARDLDGAS